MAAQAAGVGGGEEDRGARGGPAGVGRGQAGHGVALADAVHLYLRLPAGPEAAARGQAGIEHDLAGAGGGGAAGQRVRDQPGPGPVVPRRGGAGQLGREGDVLDDRGDAPYAA